MVNWENDLSRGMLWENVARIVLEHIGFIFIERSFDHRYDIVMEYKGQRATFEIKTDFYNNEYLVIEYECFGKPSGISISEAKFWLFIFPKEWKMFLIRTKKLRKLCEYGDPVIGGDYNKSKMWRFKKLDIIMNFTVIQYRHIISTPFKHGQVTLDLPVFIKKHLEE